MDVSHIAAAGLTALTLYLLGVMAHAVPLARAGGDAVFVVLVKLTQSFAPAAAGRIRGLQVLRAR